MVILVSVLLTLPWAEFASRLNCTIAWRLWDTRENDCHVTNILSTTRTTFAKARIIFMSYSVGPSNDSNRNVRVGCPDFRASVTERASVGSEKAKQRRVDTQSTKCSTNWAVEHDSVSIGLSANQI